MADAPTYGAHVADFTFRIVGAPADELSVTSFTGTEGISELFHFSVELCSANPGIKLEEMLGVGCILEIFGEFESRYVNGIVRRFKRTGEGSSLTYYAAEIVPIHWHLTRRFNCRIFHEGNLKKEQERTIPGIINKVLLDAGIPADAFDLDRLDAGAYKPREYVVQYRESDLNFISRLAEEEGIFYFFEHSAERHVMVFGDSVGAHKPVGGDDGQAAPQQQQAGGQQAAGGGDGAPRQAAVIPYRDPNSLVPEREFVFAVNARSSVETGSVVLDDHHFLRPELDLQTPPRQAERFTALHSYDYPGRYQDESEGKRYAAIRLEEQQCQRRVISMSATARHLLPGYRFTLDEHPDTTLNIEYLVTHITHRATQPESAEEQQLSDEGSRYEVNFRTIPFSVPFRPPRVTLRPTVLGSQTAEVVKKKGSEDEIYVDQYGRVKVQFYWDHEQPPEDSSMFIRVSEGWAGAGWGFMFIPRVGQEVIVDFLEGDPDRPVITGRVYNGTHMPPYKLPEEKTKSTIKTNSTEDSKRFHEIRFEDKNKKEQLFIRAQRRMDTRIIGTHYHTAGGSLHERAGGEDKDGNKKGRFYRTVKEGIDLHNEGNQYQLIDDVRQTRVEKDVLDAFMKNYALFVTDGVEINAKTTVIEMKDSIALKVGGNFILIDQSGVTIVGKEVKINSGGSAPTVKDQEGLKPLDAIPADTGKPGKRGGGGKPRTREPYKLKAQKAPPPPKRKKKGPPKPVPVPTSKRDCGIAKLDLTCEHKPDGQTRVPGPSRVLQVVPDCSSNLQYSEKWLDLVTVTIKKEWSGDDKITATVASNDGKPVGRKQTLVSSSSAAPGSGGWKDGAVRTHIIKAPANDQLWPAKARPDVCYLYGRGCDEVSHRIKVETYPSQQYEVSIGLDLFKKWMDPINDKLKAFTKSFNATGAANLIFEVIGPSGSLTGKWGWAEDADWRAYFGVEAQIGLTPICGFKIDFKVSLAVVALGSVGVPPPIGKVLADHLADVFVFVTLELTIAATGGPTARFYATGQRQIGGKAVVKGGGSVIIGLGARLGSDYVLSVEVRGGAVTKITAAGIFELNEKGLFASPKVTLGGITLKLKIVLKAFTRSVKEKELEWEAVKPRQLYPDPKKPYQPTKLFPR